MGKNSTEILKAWLQSHKNNPYPSMEEKEALMRMTDLDRSQLDHWFVNARQRYCRPKQRRGPNPNYSRYPEHITRILTDWLMANKEKPYPTAQEQALLLEKTGLTKKQLQNWFTNARKRSLVKRLAVKATSEEDTDATDSIKQEQHNLHHQGIMDRALYSPTGSAHTLPSLFGNHKQQNLSIDLSVTSPMTSSFASPHSVLGSPHSMSSLQEALLSPQHSALAQPFFLSSIGLDTSNHSSSHTSKTTQYNENYPSPDGPKAMQPGSARGSFDETSKIFCLSPTMSNNSSNKTFYSFPSSVPMQFTQPHSSPNQDRHEHFHQQRPTTQYYQPQQQSQQQSQRINSESTTGGIRFYGSSSQSDVASQFSPSNMANVQSFGTVEQGRNTQNACMSDVPYGKRALTVESPQGSASSSKMQKKAKVGFPIHPAPMTRGEWTSGRNTNDETKIAAQLMMNICSNLSGTNLPSSKRNNSSLPGTPSNKALAAS